MMMLRGTKSEQLKKSQGLPVFAPGPLPLALIFAVKESHLLKLVTNSWICATIDTH